MQQPLKSGNKFMSQNPSLSKDTLYNPEVEDILKYTKPYSKLTQSFLNWFVFFLAFPAVELFGNSITFYLFIAAGLRIGAFWVGDYKGKILLILFLLMALISTIFAPSMVRYPGYFAAVKILIQYAYWIFVGLFFITQKKRIDFLQISKWIFFGIIAATIGFYALRFKVSLSIFELTTGASRNSYVFNLLSAIPLSFYYIVQKWGKKTAMWFMPIFLMVMLLTGGRSGALLIVVQLLLISTIIYPAFQKNVKILFVVFGLLYFISKSDASQQYLDALAVQVEPINPRFADLLRGEGDGNLSFDKSWLVRKLMVDKGKEIFIEYPIFGVGPNNFNYFDSKLLTLKDYDRLQGQDAEFFNSRSAHNSYIQLLSEMGLPGLLLMISMLIIPVIFFFNKFIFGKINIDYLPLVSLLGISIHFYAIAALTGAIAWMVIGLSWSILHFNKNK